MSYVELVNYTKRIKDNTVLKNISCAFEKGNVYKIEGANGCGKTMLLRAIAGLIYPTKGHIYVNQMEVSRRKDYPCTLGVMIENPLFWKNYTGFDILKYFASINGLISEEEIKEQMKRMELDYKDIRTISKYSLGMRQKLGIIQAYMEKPDIILLDEPINALDKHAIGKLKDIINEEKERGALIIIALHNAGEFDIEYDGRISMCDGEVVEFEG